MGVLTFTSAVPSATSSFDTLPVSTASTSMVALSVSTSQMTSPAFTCWPSLTRHLASLPLSMVGERVGITIWIGIPALSSSLQRGSDPLDHDSRSAPDPSMALRARQRRLAAGKAWAISASLQPASRSMSAVSAPSSGGAMSGVARHRLDVHRPGAGCA